MTSSAEHYFDIRGRRALVTGSSRGIGHTLARGLAQAGAEVMVHGRHADGAAAAAERLAGETGATVHAAALVLRAAGAAHIAALVLARTPARNDS